MNAILPDWFELYPLEIDPRPCELCGLTIDRHEMVDDGEGPIFHCADLSLEELTTVELERRAELIRQIEVAAIVCDMELNDPRDRWKHTGEPRPPENARNSDISARPPAIPRPGPVPQATVDAFKYVVALGDPEYLARWLRDHSDVAPTLLLGLPESV
jgi:hypothetical protein